MRKPVLMYMVRGPACLAPAYGIAYKRKMLTKRWRPGGKLKPGFKIVRVTVSEIDGH
jgi:hypothetical protein